MPSYMTAISSRYSPFATFLSTAREYATSYVVTSAMHFDDHRSVPRPRVSLELMEEIFHDIEHGTPGIVSREKLLALVDLTDEVKKRHAGEDISPEDIMSEALEEFARKDGDMAKCKYCGASDLKWKKLPTGWRLFAPDGSDHTCLTKGTPITVTKEPVKEPIDIPIPSPGMYSPIVPASPLPTIPPLDLHLSTRIENLETVVQFLSTLCVHLMVLDLEEPDAIQRTEDLVRSGSIDGELAKIFPEKMVEIYMDHLHNGGFMARLSALAEEKPKKRRARRKKHDVDIPEGSSAADVSAEKEEEEPPETAPSDEFKPLPL